MLLEYQNFMAACSKAEASEQMGPNSKFGTASIEARQALRSKSGYIKKVFSSCQQPLIADWDSRLDYAAASALG